MDLFEAIAARHSYRGQYESTPVPREDLQRIMQAGLAAPSGCNEQTTSLIGIDDAALVQKVGGMLHKPNFASAPAAICVLTRPVIAYAGRTFHVQDYAAAIENMLLAICALGYASCWVEGYVTKNAELQAEMAAALGVPGEYQLVAYLPVGVPAAEGGRATYKPFAKRAALNGFAPEME